MIRKARLEDIPALEWLLQQILQVHHQARPDIFRAKGQKFSQEELVSLLENPRHPIFVYESKGHVLGHLFCQIQEPKNNVLMPIKTLFIEDLCVDEQARGQKIGEQLYDFAVAYAKKEGCHNLTLEVWNDNVGASRFYERLGMTVQHQCMEVRLSEDGVD